jgi:hypothetical protein
LSSNVSDVFPKVLKLSFEVSECKPLVVGAAGEDTVQWCRSRQLALVVGRCRLTLSISR